MNSGTDKLKQAAAELDASILADVAALWSELQRLGYDHFQLAALETRRAGESFVTLLLVGVMIAVLLIAAWLGILTVAILVLIEQGMLVSSAVLAAIAVNLILVLCLAGVMRHHSRFLQWPACLHSLRQKPIKPRHNKSTTP
jgi:hypothetical protein